MLELDKTPIIASEIANVDFHGVSVRYEAFLGLARITTRDLTKSDLSALSKTLGDELPQTPNTVTGKTLKLAWLAPGEWLLIGPADTLAKKLPVLSKKLAKKSALVSDLTHGRASFIVSDEGARNVLASLCPLDLHPRVFPDFSCASTIVAGTGAFIQKIDEGFRLIVDQSMGAHIYHLIQQASENYKLTS